MRLSGMRWGAVALGGAAAFAIAGVAPAAEEQERLGFSVSPAKAGRPQTVGFALDSTAPWTAARVFFALPAGTVWNGGRFPRCRFTTLADRRKVDARGVNRDCPRGSRVGSGHATIVHVTPTVTIRERIRVTAVNAGATVHLVMLGRSDSVIDGKRHRGVRVVVWKGRPPSQGQVTAWVPATDPIQLPLMQTARLEHFDLKLGNTRQSRGILELPSCRRGRWRAAAAVQYIDLTDFENERRGLGEATDTVRCRA